MSSSRANSKVYCFCHQQSISHKPPPAPRQISFACSHGQGRVWPRNWPSMEESRIPAVAEDPKAQCKQLPSHRTQPGPHCFHVIVVLGGWGKTIFQGPRAGRRKERLLCFQACVMGEAASAGVFPSWSLQLPHSAETQTTDPMSPNLVSVGGQMCSVDAPRPPFFSHVPHRELLPG